MRQVCMCVYMWERIKYWIFTLSFTLSITFPLMKELKKPELHRKPSFRKPQLTSVLFYRADPAGRRLVELVLVKAPLMGSSLWNTNESSPRRSEWCKFGLIVRLLLFLSVFFFLFLKSSHRIVSVCLSLCVICVCSCTEITFWGLVSWNNEYF